MARGFLLIALAAVSWGTTGTTMALLARGADASPILVGVARLVVAAPILLALARLAEGPLSLPGRGPAIAAGVCVAAYQVCYFLAVPRSGVALTALVAICTAPLLIAVLASVGLGERLTGRTVVALTAGVAGTALIVAGPGGPGSGPRPASGVLLALGAGLSYALYAVVTKRGLAGASPLSLAAATFGIAAVALAPALLVVLPGAGGPPLAEQLRRGWPLLLYLGAVPTAAAYALYTTGLRRVPAVAAGIGTLLEPLTAAALGVLLFGERLGAAGGLGAALLVGALLLLPVRPAAQEPT